jgi:tetratricopeptide (TPR) repeat protein
MLMAGEGYRPRSSAFLQAVAGGLSAAAAFASVYGKSLDVVFADLTAYIRKDRFVFFAADYRDPDPERTFGTRDVDDFESGLITANLLAEHPDRAPAARAAYETLAAQRPDDVELAEARATFEFRRGDAQAAEPLVKKALLLGSRNPQLYGLAARYARSPDERETLFARALELDPANLDVRFAYLDSLMQAREWPKALAVLAVIQPVPADEAYTVFQLRANVLARLGRLEDARAAARRAREFARPGREAEYADRLLQSLDAAGAGR